ncbi:MAG: ATP-binding protein [Sulfitobacter sp.]
MTLPLPVSDVLAAVPLPALAIAQGEQILSINATAQKLLGLPAQGRHFITVLRQPAVVEVVERCLAQGTQGTAEYLTREDGHDVTYTVTVTAVGDSGTVLVTFQDISHVAAASQMRRDFVAIVSHELRTPLTALMGFIETLRGPARDDATARERFLETMTKETERMNRLVGDLLSLSRVEADERVRPSGQVDLVAIMSTTMRNLNPLAVEAGVTLVPQLPDHPVQIGGDSDQLMQVFTNLIENAIKYGGADKPVTITLTEHDEIPALRAAGIQVSVRDEGPGIEPQHLPRLTERFYRADSHRSRALGGTGLGLAIVKHILNRHRGRIKIASELGQGSVFTVLLPIK